MDIFSKKFDLESRSSIFNIYPIGDCHIGAPNFAKERLQKYIRLIKADKNQKAAFLLGDLLDLILLRDLKRYTAANLDDETLTGKPKQIRKNLSNLAVNQAKKAIKILEPIKDIILGSVKGNHPCTLR